MLDSTPYEISAHPPLCLAPCALPAPLWPSRRDRRNGHGRHEPDSSAIAAVVDGQVITTQDVANRARLLAVTMGIPPTPDALSRLAPQVTKQLIDQTLQLQEANKLNVTVSDDDVASAIGHIEQNNNMPQGALRQRLGAIGVPLSTLLAQIRTSWAGRPCCIRCLGQAWHPRPAT